MIKKVLLVILLPIFLFAFTGCIDDIISGSEDENPVYIGFVSKEIMSEGTKFSFVHLEINNKKITDEKIIYVPKGKQKVKIVFKVGETYYEKEYKFNNDNGASIFINTTELTIYENK